MGPAGGRGQEEFAKVEGLDPETREAGRSEWRSKAIAIILIAIVAHLRGSTIVGRHPHCGFVLHVGARNPATTSALVVTMSFHTISFHMHYSPGVAAFVAPQNMLCLCDEKRKALWLHLDLEREKMEAGKQADEVRMKNKFHALCTCCLYEESKRSAAICRRMCPHHTRTGRTCSTTPFYPKM